MIRKQSAEEQIATMQHLINFGVNENTAKTEKPIVEFKKKAANGKTYGIIRESTKYYIMEAPQKDTEILAEDFDYIGGYNNRKENEYTSYSKASNALDLKIMSINETVNKENRVMVEAPVIKADWEDKLTESMRKEIERFKTLTRNINSILTEGEIGKAVGSIPSEHTIPEAPKQNPSEKEVNAPYTESGVAKGDKDFKKEEHNHETAGTPYDKDGKSSVEKNMTSDKKPNVKTDSNDLTDEKTYEPDNNIASQHKTGKNPIGIFENKGKKIRLKLTEEQVLTWNDNKDFMDTKQGTHVGSSDPFTDELGEKSNQTEADTDPIIKEGNGDSVVYDHPLDQDSPTPGTTDVETEDGDPFIKPIMEKWEDPDDEIELEFGNDDFLEKSALQESQLFELDDDDAAGFDDLEDTDELPDDSEWYGDEDEDGETDIEIVPDNIDADAEEFTPERANNDIEDLRRQLASGENDDFYGDDFGGFYESRRRGRLSEDKLNVFGKHPAWRKQPMTTPPNKEVAINGAREWDDESAQGEEPYAQQIGDGSPFNQIVKDVTESVLKNLFNKKKV